MRARRTLLLTLVACFAAAACSAIVDPDKGTLGNPPPLPCVPGTVNDACACEDGSLGTQTCNELQRYDVCVCVGLGGAGGGAP